MAQTHWKKLINPDYIGAYALDPGKDLTVQISQVHREMVTGADGNWQLRSIGCILPMELSFCSVISAAQGVVSWSFWRTQHGSRRDKAEQINGRCCGAVWTASKSSRFHLLSVP